MRNGCMAGKVILSLEEYNDLIRECQQLRFERALLRKEVEFRRQMDAQMDALRELEAKSHSFFQRVIAEAGCGG